jgi:hypothetical protein
LLLAAPRAHVPEFAALLDAWQDNGVAVEVSAYDRDIPDVAALAARCAGLDAVLLAAPARYAPRTMLPGPFLQNGEGRIIAAAWLPVRGAASVRRFSEAAARVQRRRRQTPTLALLGQWHPKYLKLSDRVQDLVKRPVRAFRWTSDIIGREAVVEALGAGLALGVYLGHGRASGWVGYYGMRTRHFESFHGEPLGSLLSLCCRTASRRRTGLSFAEALPLLGVAAASFGAVTETRHTDNTRWVVRISERLGNGADTVGELLVRAAPPNLEASAPYRLIGDPLAPLRAETAGARRAAAVITYP